MASSVVGVIVAAVAGFARGVVSVTVELVNALFDWGVDLLVLKFESVVSCTAFVGRGTSNILRPG